MLRGFVENKLVVVGNWSMSVDWGVSVSLDDWSVDNWSGLVNDCIESIMVIGGVVNSSD